MKKNSYKNTVQKKTIEKWIIASVAILLVAILAVGYVGAALALKNWNPVKWFDKNQETTTTQNDNTTDTTNDGAQPSNVASDDTFGGMVVGESVGQGDISLMSTEITAEEYEEYGISTQSVESAVNVSAVIIPEAYKDSKLDWTVVFSNPKSSWATGKTATNYVTVTPTSDGATTATVSCLQAFGEPILIKATVRNATNLTGTCQADYERKVGTNLTLTEYYNSATWSLNPTNTNPIVEFPNFPDAPLNDLQPWILGTCNLSSNGETYAPTYLRTNEVNFGVSKSNTYTVDNTDSGTDFVYKAYVSASSGYLNALTTAGYSVDKKADTYYHLYYDKAEHEGAKIESGEHVCYNYILFETYLTKLVKPDSTMWNNFKCALIGNTATATISLKLEAYSGDNVISSTTYNIQFSEDSLTVGTQAVDVESDIVF